MAGQSPSRGYPLATHRGVEAAIGFAMLVIALVVAVDPGGSFDFSGGATAACGLFGLVLTTLGLATTREGAGVGPSTHRAFDIVIVAALAILAIIFAVGGETAEFILFAAAALGQGFLSFRTKYTLAGGE